MNTKIFWTPKGDLTRGLKAKNIFNLSSCKFTRQWGQIGEDNEKGDHLAVMPGFDEGNYATLEQIRFNKLKLGFFIPYFFGQAWSGDPARKYGKTLASIMKVNAFLPLSFAKNGDSLLRAVAIMEQGAPCRDIPVGYFLQYINGEA